MRQAHLSHLAEVAKVAAKEVPELAQKLVLKPGTSTYLAFRTAARGMAAEAESQKEVLVKHGLVESVLVDLNQSLDQFDAAVDQGTAGRQAHVGASAELNAVADEIVQIVRVMDGLNRYRFAATVSCWRRGRAPATSWRPLDRTPSRIRRHRAVKYGRRRERGAGMKAPARTAGAFA